jgi:hypothetical protein
MAATRVFVDDAVLGRLPAVCAKTGVATSDHLIMTVPVGTSEGLGIAWLLILAGPIGWLGLFIYATFRRVETLTVQLPYCETAYAELTAARRTRRNSGLSSIILFVVALVATIPSTFAARAIAAALAVIALGLLVTYIIETLHLRRLAVRVDLDGSRRWVTLSNVNDAFAEAVRQSLADHYVDRR